MNEPTEPTRVRAFARFFKNYMSVSTIVVAALPIPVNLIGLIPVFEAHRNILSVYSSVFCFLVLGFIFYARHAIAKLLFVEKRSEGTYQVSTQTLVTLKIAGSIRSLQKFTILILPFILILGAIYCVYMYQFYLTESILKLRFESEGLIYQDALTFTEMDKIPYGTLLITYYISFFILAEGAFVFMAIKEYLQDLLGLSEVDLIEGKKVESNRLSE